jgi:hypothetical protein
MVILAGCLVPITFLFCEKSKEASDDDKIDPRLFAFYSFDGNADDETGNGHDATVSGATLIDDRFGNEASAYLFDGDDDYIICPEMTDFPEGKTPRTISGWFKSSITNPTMMMLFGCGSAQNGYSFQVGIGAGTTGTQYRVNGWGTPNDWQTGVKTPAYLDGTWHHCAVTYDGTTTKIYFDGVLKSETSGFSYIAKPETMVFVIGHEIDLEGWEWNGALDDIGIYTAALSADDIGVLAALH